MAAKKKSEDISEEPRQLPPVFTDEARENRCIALAYDLVEQRLLDGSASAQETVHFLKLGSMKERKEMKMLDEKIKLTEAQTENLQSMKKIEELYDKAISSMREYQGKPAEDVVIFDGE